MIVDVLGMCLFLVIIGYFVMEICFPKTYHSLGFWMVCSFGVIPAAGLVVLLVVSFPALIFLLLILAFAGKS